MKLSKSQKTLLLFVLSFFLAGIIEGISLPIGEAFIFVHAIIIAILIFSWCGSHANENGITPASGSKILAAVAPPIGIPYYLYAGFGFKQGSIKIAMALVLAVVSQGIYMMLYYALTGQST